MSTEHQLISDYQQARLRTEMYFGSRAPVTRTVLEYGPEGARAVETTWVPAVYVAFREIVDNAVDEVVARGHGDRIDIWWDDTNATGKVIDNGRGMPFTPEPKTGKPWATVLLGMKNSSSNYNDAERKGRGMNGVGGAIVNFCSEWFTVEIERDRKVFMQRFDEGEELVAGEPAIVPSGSRRTGTKIGWRLSKKVFPDLTLPVAFVRSRIFELALCYPNLTIYFNGQKLTVPKGGVPALFPGKTVLHLGTRVSGRGSATFWMVPEFLTEGEGHHTLVNGIWTVDGGVHVDNFRRGFYSGVLSALERESKRRKLVPNRSDIDPGMLCFGITEVSAPTFDSQTKSRFVDEEVGTAVKKALDDEAIFRSLVKSNPEWVEAIFARCAERTLKRDLADIGKMAKKAKREKIAGLEDASGVDRSKCILFLAEGNSAVAGVVEARDAEIHGALPLKGKPPNVRELSAKEAMENEALGKIIKAIGLVPGQRVNRHALRYGKVYLTCDADEDGKNIIALLVNFFHSYWPELLDPERAPFLYVLETPLIIAVKGKDRRYWYDDNKKSFDPEKHRGWEITRAKGLAALKREDWKVILANPKLRPVLADEHLKEALTLLFEKNAAAAERRREWIGL